MPLPAQPLEFTDFSGGITENVLQGDPRRYASADNFLITVDKKLRGRWGTIPYVDNERLPSGDQRVNGIYSLINETVLMGQSGRSLYVIDENNPTWTPILGPDGASPIQGGNTYSQTTYAEFQKQIYFTSEGISPNAGVRPSKLFRDENNIWKALTAGFPQVEAPPNYTEGTLLLKMITNANALRASFIAHFSDAVNATYSQPFIGTGYNPNFLHLNRDRIALNYFVAQTFSPFEPQPAPGVTQAPNATDEASLYVLLTALNTAYTLHTADARKFSYGTNPNILNAIPLYHFTFTLAIGNGSIGLPTGLPVKGPLADLTNTTSSTTLEEAATQLDDVLMKWNWHRKGVWTHSEDNNPLQYNRYDPAVTKVGTIYFEERAPTITPDYSDLFNYVNNLKALYNYHIENEFLGLFYGHSQPNNRSTSLMTNWRMSADDCTDLESMYLNIYWLRSMYQAHYSDATVPIHTQITFTCTNNSPNLTAVALATGGAYTIPFGSILYAYPSQCGFEERPGTNNGSGSSVAIVIASGSGTATLDRRVVIGGGAGRSGQTSYSFYHVIPQTTATTATNQSSPTSALGSPPDTLGSTLKTWLSLADEFFFSFADHAYSGTVHRGDAAGDGMAGIFTNALDALTNKFFIPKVATVAYAFFYAQDYVVEPNGVEYLTRGNPTYTDSIDIAVSYPLGYLIPSEDEEIYPSVPAYATRANVISDITPLSNTADTNYDLSNVKVQIYKTSDGGTTFYFLDEVNNGVTTYNDTTSSRFDGSGTIPTPGEDPLTARETLYTTGGRVGDDQPPECKYLHLIEGTMYYGAVQDGDQFLPNRIRQSIQLAPDSSPATFYVDLDDDLRGISSARNVPIALCKNSIFRLEGTFNEIGQGQINPERISDTLGCVNAKSIVQTEIGVFFAGTDGFYYTDGYQIIKISLELNKTYAALTSTDSQKKSIYGSYDQITRTIYWAMKKDPTDTDNSIVYIYYLDYGVKPSGTFTTMSNKSYFRPSSLVFVNGKFFYGHENGYILHSDTNVKTDPKIDLDVSPEDWDTLYIPWDYTSCAVDVGTIFKRKWMTKIHIVGENEGNVAMQIYAVRDLTESAARPLAPINYIQNCTWGQPIFYWGDPSFIWQYDGKMDVWRRFPRTTLRSDFMQVKMVPADICVYASSVGFPFGANAVVDNTAKTATILTPGLPYTDIVWPLDVIDYYIHFSYDKYAQGFLITDLDVTQKIITFEDPDNLSLNAPSGVQWEIRGIKKEQTPVITSFVLHYAYLGDENQSYPGAYSNSGPGNAGGNPR